MNDFFTKDLKLPMCLKSNYSRKEIHVRECQFRIIRVIYFLLYFCLMVGQYSHRCLGAHLMAFLTEILDYEVHIWFLCTNLIRIAYIF